MLMRWRGRWPFPPREVSVSRGEPESGTRHSELVEQVRRLAGDCAIAVGVEIVDVDLRGSSRQRIVRIDVDREGPRGVTLDDCQHLSEALGRRIDETGTLESRYVLEVSSPGLDRRLRTWDDFRRCRGRRLVVALSGAAGSRHEICGEVVGLEADTMQLRVDPDTQVSISLTDIIEARQEVHF